MGNSVTIQVQLERDIYCPGNLVRGVVLVRCEGSALQLNGIRAVMVTELVQHFYDGSAENQNMVTTILGGQAIPLTTGQSHFVLRPGAHSFPFAFQLNPAQLPTIKVESNGVLLAVRNTIAVEAELKGGVKRGEPREIIIVSAIPAHLHQNPAPRTASDQNAVICCCCSQGVITLTVSVDRSVIATDRDRNINFMIRVANDTSEIVGAVHVALVATTTPKAGNARCAPSQVVCSTRTESVPPHTVRDVRGTLPLPMVITSPSLNSSILDVTYSLRCCAETGGCCTDDSTSRLGPIVVAHTVDMSQQQFAATTQQAYVGPNDPRQFSSQNLYFAPPQQQQQQQQPPMPQWQPGMAPQQWGPPPPPPPQQQQQEPYDVAPQQGYEAPPPLPPPHEGPNAAYGDFAPPPPAIFKEHSPLAPVPPLPGIFETHSPDNENKSSAAEKDEEGQATKEEAAAVEAKDGGGGGGGNEAGEKNGDQSQ